MIILEDLCGDSLRFLKVFQTFPGSNLRICFVEQDKVTTLFPWKSNSLASIPLILSSFSSSIHVFKNVQVKAVIAQII